MNKMDSPMIRLFVRDGGKIVPVPLSGVERFEACDDFILVHSGQKSFTMSLTMNDLEDYLDPLTFVRIHRSHIVNLGRVASLIPYDGSRFELTLLSGTKILSSRHGARGLRKLMRWPQHLLLPGEC